MQTPLISVIVPIYKVEAYLDKCIESVVKQFYSSLEIILVDDGSPDECSRICDCWKLKDERIVVIHKENGGPSDARNVGLSVAKGKYIYFLDGDDYIDFNLIELVLPFMESGYDMVVFGHYENWPDGREIKRSRERTEYRLDCIEKKAKFINHIVLGYHLGWEPWNRIFRRELIEKYTIRFEEHKRIFSEDLYFCLNYCAHIERVMCLAECPYHYVQRADSTMGTKGRQIILNEMNELGKAVFMHYQQHEDSAALLRYFPVTHYLIVNNVMQHVLRNRICSIKELRRMVYNGIEDQTFFWKNAEGFLRNAAYVRKIKGSRLAAEYISLCRYLFDGRYLSLRLRNRIISLLAEVVGEKKHS